MSLVLIFVRLLQRRELFTLSFPSHPLAREFSPRASLGLRKIGKPPKQIFHNKGNPS